MPLTQAQIIEIQASADYNQRKRMREQEEQKAQAEVVKEKIAASKESVKKG